MRDFGDFDVDVSAHGLYELDEAIAEVGLRHRVCGNKYEMIEADALHGSKKSSLQTLIDTALRHLDECPGPSW